MCSKYSRIKFACFSFHVGLLFINFSSFKPDTENNANFDAARLQPKVEHTCVATAPIIGDNSQLANNYQHQRLIRITSLFVYNNNDFNTDRLSIFMSAVGNIREPLASSRTYQHFSQAK